MNKKLAIAISAILTSGLCANPGLVDSVKNFFGRKEDIGDLTRKASGGFPVRHTGKMSIDPKARVNHWLITIEALKAHGIRRDSDTMNWAKRNLHRAEKAELGFAKYGNKYFRRRAHNLDRAEHRNVEEPAKRKYVHHRQSARTRAERARSHRTIN